MRSAEKVLALALLMLLGACASAPSSPVTKPLEAAPRAAPQAMPAAVAAAVPVAPVDPQVQREFDTAKADLRAGRTADAERGFRQLAVQHPELGGAHANLGLMLRSAARHDESVAALERAVKASPRQPAFWHQLGLSYRHQGQFAKAREAYEQALSLDPNFADAHLNLGVLLDLVLGDNVQALVHYERYLALAPAADATVGKWIADLKTRKPSASVAHADAKTVKKDP
jgi:tetratricopeptide (TPR) repeat protein